MFEKPDPATKESERQNRVTKWIFENIIEHLPGHLVVIFLGGVLFLATGASFEEWVAHWLNDLGLKYYLQLELRLQSVLLGIGGLLILWSIISFVRRRMRATRFVVANIGMPAATERVPLFDDNLLFNQSQNELYSVLKKRYEKSPSYMRSSGGKAVFYHYSGFLLRPTALDLYNHGYDVKIVLQDESLPKLLGCDYQWDRILAAKSQYGDEFRNGGRSGNGRVRIFQSKAPLVVRGAIVDDEWAVIGWYLYGMRKDKHGRFPNDTRNLMGDDSFGFFVSNEHPVFESIREFLRDYEERIAPEHVWSSQ
jgi:hypothetical protein